MILLTTLIFAMYATSFSADSKKNSDYSFLRKQLILETGLANFTSTFAKIVLKEASEPEQNIVVSPLSLYTTLISLHLGSNGQTRDEISSALGIRVFFYPGDPSDEEQKYYQHFSAAIKELQNVSSAQVQIGNGLFVRAELPPRQEYKQAVSTLYDGELISVDFASGTTKPPVDEVNRWISDKTKGKITKSFTKPFAKDTAILPASSIFFSGLWRYKFPKSQTKPGQFKSGSKEIDVQMMTDQRVIPYVNNPRLHYEAIRLPFSGYKFAMYIVLPYQNYTLRKLVNDLDTQEIRMFSGKMVEYTDVIYQVPRMKFNVNAELQDRLSEFGVKALFNDADLSAFTSSTASPLKISKLIHATNIELDEDGALPSSALVLEPDDKIPEKHFYTHPHVDFIVNRPFMFLITHADTNLILYSGLVYKP